MQYDNLDNGVNTGQLKKFFKGAGKYQIVFHLHSQSLIGTYTETLIWIQLRMWELPIPRNFSSRLNTNRSKLLVSQNYLFGMCNRLLPVLMRPLPVPHTKMQWIVLRSTSLDCVFWNEGRLELVPHRWGSCLCWYEWRCSLWWSLRKCRWVTIVWLWMKRKVKLS